jgi:DivIVA domain-containing protein
VTAGPAAPASSISAAVYSSTAAIAAASLLPTGRQLGPIYRKTSLGTGGWRHTSAHDEPGSRPLTRHGEDRAVTGEQVRDTTFLITRGGYDVAEVDDLLRSIAAELDAGRPVEPLLRNATFRARWRGAQGAGGVTLLLMTGKPGGRWPGPAVMACP